jgi:thiosulfate/3-mercaptopyruvate sulfurtransferase
VSNLYGLDCVLSLKRLLPLAAGVLVVATGMLLAACGEPEAAATPPTAVPKPSVEARQGSAPQAASPAPAVGPASTVDPASLAPLPVGLGDSPYLIDTDWLAANIDRAGLLILDVRSTGEFDTGHIAGAVNVPPADMTAIVDRNNNMAPSAADFTAVLQAAGVNGGASLVIVDGGNLRWASRMFWTLEYFGHTDVSVLHGGLAAWSGEGRPLSAEATNPPAGDFEARAESDRLAGMGDVLDRLDDPDAMILDTRSPAEFAGEDVRAARGGHIPGAVNVDWILASNDTAAPTLKPAEELRALYEGAGVTPDRAMILIYCQSGMRASHTYLVLRLLGYENLRLYDASWAEWGNDAEVPIESGAGAASESVADPASKPVELEPEDDDLNSPDDMDCMCRGPKPGDAVRESDRCPGAPGLV